MSAGRRHRRRIRQNRRGVGLLLAELPDDAPAPIKNALARRNAASVTGRCVCGAVGVFDAEPDANGIHHIRFEHEDDCDASDAGIEALSDKYGWPA